MWSLAVDTWMGNAAAVLSECWGAVSRRAKETGYSRTSIYKAVYWNVYLIVEWFTQSVIETLQPPLDGILYL
jgi:hypothetical protein